MIAGCGDNMDAFAVFAVFGLVLSLTGLTVSVVSWFGFVVLPYIGWRSRVRAVADDLDRLAAELDGAVEPVVRGGVHCPSCGRFARVTSTSWRGVWVRCTVHGVRLRGVRRIGRADAIVVEVAPHVPVVPFEAPPLPSPLSVSEPVRFPDWLDAVPVGLTESRMTS